MISYKAFFTTDVFCLYMEKEPPEKKASSNSVNRRELLKKTAIAGGVLSATASVGVPVAEAVDVDTTSAIQTRIGEGYTTGSGETLKLRRLQTRKSFVYLPLPDVPAVHHSEDQQFLLASIDASDFLPECGFNPRFEILP
jgi:hypothetical protein